jgi:hypothetical protein
MLSADELDRLDSLSRAFRRALEARLPAGTWSERVRDYLEIRIAARHEETGDISARVSPGHVTLSVGRYFLCNFPLDRHEELAPEQAELAVARDTAQYIADFLADRIVLRVSWRDGRLCSAETYARGIRVSPPTPEDREYAWSGPLDGPVDADITSG